MVVLEGRRSRTEGTMEKALKVLAHRRGPCGLGAVGLLAGAGPAGGLGEKGFVDLDAGGAQALRIGQSLVAQRVVLRGDEQGARVCEKD